MAIDAGNMRYRPHEMAIGALFVLSAVLGVLALAGTGVPTESSMADELGAEAGAVGTVRWLDELTRLVVDGTAVVTGTGSTGDGAVAGVTRARAEGDEPTIDPRDTHGADPGGGGTGPGGGGGDGGPAGTGTSGSSPTTGGPASGGGSVGGGSGAGVAADVGVGVGGSGATANVDATVQAPIADTSVTAGASVDVGTSPTGGVDANVGVQFGATVGPVTVPTTPVSVGTGGVSAGGLNVPLGG